MFPGDRLVFAEQCIRDTDTGKYGMRLLFLGGGHIDSFSEGAARKCKELMLKQAGSLYDLSKDDLVIKRDALIENIIGNSNSVNIKVDHNILSPQADYIQFLRARVKADLAELEAIFNVLSLVHDIDPIERELLDEISSELEL